MTNRRNFIKHASKGLIVLGASHLPIEAFGKNDATHVTILHTNDVHSRIEPFPMDGSRNQGMGGAARRAAIIKKIRAQTKNVLLFDSGDMLQGTPYFNFYDGELEFQLMNEMKYDAATLGNHDFDGGMEQLAKLIDGSSFPMLCSNYGFENTPLNSKTKPYKIFEFKNVKIGVFGLGIKLKGLVPQKLFGETLHSDPIEKAKEISKILKQDLGCDYVVCLSHLGFAYEEKDIYSDIIIAKSTSNIDLILGGHTHTFLEEPLLVENSTGKEVLINQVGWAGMRIGRLDLRFDFERKNRIARPEIILVRP